MAWNFLASQSASSSTGNAATTAAINTTGATLFVVAVANIATEVAATVTDSQSNNWTGLTRKTVGGAGAVQLFYSANPTTNASHTFTAGAQAGFGLVIAVAAYSGTNPSPFDAENGTTTANPGTVTQVVAGELLVAACQDASGGGPVVNAATNATTLNLQTVGVSGGVHFGLGLIHGYGTSGAGGTVGMTFGAGVSPSSVIAAFKAVLSGGYLPVN